MTQAADKVRVIELEGARGPVAPVRPASADPVDVEPTLADYLSTLHQYRWLIAWLAVVFVGMGALYLVATAPKYRSDVLLQVEDKQKGIAGLEDLSSLMGEKVPAETEIEILRSRTLLGSVVDELNLTVEARPRTFPIFGGAFLRSWADDGLRAPVLGLGSFAWGGERITVTRLEVPDELLDKPLRLVSNGSQFTLRGPSGETLLTGEVGKAASRERAGEKTEIFVRELEGRPGTQFRVVKRRRAGVIDDLQTDLRISEKGKKTGILTVSLDDRDPRKVADILDAISRAYVRQNVERKSAEAAKTLEFLKSELPEVKKNVEASESALKAYHVKNGSVDLGIETQAILDRAVEIDKALTELNLNRSELRQRFTENHPVLLSLKEKESQLRAQKAGLESKMKGLPAQEVESVRLERDAKVASELYFLLLNKTQELNVVKSGTIGNVRILDAALKPYEPVSPKGGQVLALALLLGLGAGVAAAFAKKALDHGVEDPAEIESGLGLSVYASVPLSEKEERISEIRKRSGAAVILASEDPSDLAIESLRSLRTALQFALVDSRNNVVTVGGPSPGVGKSFLSVNLAYVLATTGKRVLLIDGDVRRGHLHKFLGGKRAGGLSEVVSGQLPLKEAIRETSHEHLNFISTGKIPPNPAELVGSPRFQAFLAEVSKQYDLVLVDTAPILAVTDGALIARHAGVNLLVVRAGKHPLREIAQAVKHYQDAGVGISGAVMNAVPVGTGRYGRYAYSYHYQYAYKSAAQDQDE